MIEEQRNIRALVFVKIELDGLTLRFCNEHAVATDTDGADYFWEGRLKDISPITSGFNDFRSSNSLVSNSSITLWNGKPSRTGTNLDAFVEDYFWGRKKVSVFLIEQEVLTLADSPDFWRVGDEQYLGDEKMVGPTSGGRSTEYVLSSNNLVFKGVIGFPDIFEKHNDEELVFSVYDERYNDQIILAKNTIQQGPFNSGFIFSEPADSSIGKNIPVIYGDFSDDDDLPAYLVVTSTRNFQLADYTIVSDGQSALKEITEVYRNGSPVSETQNLSTGSFTIPAYTAGDIITVAAKGMTRGTQIASVFGRSSSDLLEHPVEVLYDLLVNRLGVDPSDIDTASFIQAYNIDSSKKCRRWVGGRESVVSLINDLSFEFGIDLFSLNGFFQCKVLSLSTSSPVDSFDEDDFEERSYISQTDPNRSYFNAVAINYSTDYQNQILKQNILLSNPSKISSHGITQTIFYDMKWNYIEASINERFGSLLYIFQNPVTHVSFTGMYRAFNIKPTDVISFNFHKFSSENMIVRSIARDLRTFKTQITAWFIGEIPLKNWAESTASSPASFAEADASSDAVYHATLNIQSAFNDTIAFKISSTVYVAYLTAGVYTVSSLCSHIVTQMNAAASTTGFSCSYSASTRKFNIGYSGAFEIFLNTFTGAVFSSVPYRNERTARGLFQNTLGFDVSSNKTGGSSYSSDYICLFDADIASIWG